MAADGGGGGWDTGHVFRGSLTRNTIFHRLTPTPQGAEGCGRSNEKYMKFVRGWPATAAFPNEPGFYPGMDPARDPAHLSDSVRLDPATHPQPSQILSRKAFRNPPAIFVQNSVFFSIFIF